MKQIPLTQNQVALVDDEDYEKLIKFKWHALKHKRGFYAITTLPRQGGKQKSCRMHRLLLKLTDHKELGDHINRNTLDNQKNNLRSKNHSQNRARCISDRPTKPVKFKGVIASWKYKGKWSASIMKDGKKYSLGVFKKPEDAALAYNKKAIELYGEFANPNKITA